MTNGDPNQKHRYLCNMELHPIWEGHAELDDILDKKSKRNETYKLAVVARDAAAQRHEDAEKTLSALVRRVKDEELQVNAAKDGVIVARNLLMQAEDKERAAKGSLTMAKEEESKGRQLVELQLEKTKEKEKEIAEVPTVEAYDKELKTKQQDLSTRIDNGVPAFRAWMDEFFDHESSDLLRQPPYHLFMAKKDEKKNTKKDGINNDNESEASDQSEPPKEASSFREAIGMAQRLNSPMYMTERAVSFVYNKYIDAKRGQSHEKGSPMPLDYKNVSGGTLFLMLDDKCDRLTSAPEQVLLAVVLSSRLDDRTAEIQQADVSKKTNMLTARGQAAGEFVKEYKSGRVEPLTKTDEKLKRKIMSTASTGRLFKKIVDYYGHGILVVLPLAELFNFSRKQRTDNIPKGTVEALVEIVVSNQHNKRLIEFLKDLVKILRPWLDYSNFKFDYKIDKINDIKDFMAAIGELRERLNLPATSAIPFAQRTGIDINPVGRWEMLASVSGWDPTHEGSVVCKDREGKLLTVKEPNLILAHIFGTTFSIVNKVLVVHEQTDFAPATMAFLIRILRIKNSTDSLCIVRTIDARNGRRIDIQTDGSIAHSINAAIFVVLTPGGWVVVHARKPKAGPHPFTKAWVLSYPLGDDPRADDWSGPAAVQALLPDDNDVKVHYIPDDRPQDYCSGIHALCNALTVDSLGHNWLIMLTEARVVNLRHTLLHIVSTTLIRGFKDEEAQNET